MTDQREVLRQALAALEAAESRTTTFHEVRTFRLAAIESIRAALEAPAAAPLSNKQIRAAGKKADVDWLIEKYTSSMPAFAREIERAVLAAHGIGIPPQRRQQDGGTQGEKT